MNWKDIRETENRIVSELQSFLAKIECNLFPIN